MTEGMVLFFYLASAILATSVNVSWAGEGSWLQKRVCRFVFHGGKPDKRTHIPEPVPIGIGTAAGALASQAEVPICVEELPTISFENAETIAPIEIDARDANVREILDEMIRQDPRYEYRERLGVIEVLPIGADRDPDDCLNLVIPSFKYRVPWNALISQLRIQVAVVAKSSKDGAVRGGSALPHPPPGLIEVDFENQTLRDILSSLSAKVGNMAWGARFEGARPTCENISFGMGQLKKWYPSETVPLTFTEGLPKNCLTCHYHQPCPAK